MKGVVLSGGSGTRLRPLTYSIAKQLVPVAGEPVLFHGIREMARAGIEETAVIISPETGDQVVAALESAPGLGVDFHFIIQPEPRGLADALRLALPFVDGDDCLMYLGDNLVQDGVRRLVDDFAASGADCQILVAPVDRPQEFGIVELDGDGRITRLVEKPADPPSDLAIVGVYAFGWAIADAVRAIEPSVRGEYEITDAIQHLLATGHRVMPTRQTGWWKDTGRREDVLEANRLLLDGLTGEEVDGRLVECRVEGPVRVAAGAKLSSCTLRGPLVVGAGVTAQGSTLGPHVSIGGGCVVEDAEIRNSVLMDDVVVQGWRLADSLIGPEARITPPAPQEPVVVTLGQRCELGAS